MKFILPLLIIFFVGCKTTDKVIIENTEYRLNLPPGTVKIDDNFFADETEISIQSYREYLFWVRSIHGVNSDEYKFAMPDTLVCTDVTHNNYIGEPYVGRNEFSWFANVLRTHFIGHFTY